jgi:thiol-disulfide isomerase/thioredoxin
VTRLPCAREVAARTTRIVRAVLAGSAVLAAASCSGGALAQNTPLSSGQSFVEGSYSSTYYSPGSRPAAPAVAGALLTGQRFSLAADRGTVVVLNFWGSWCAPCRQEAPALAALARHFPQDQVRFVGVDIRDSVPSAEAFQRTFGVGYPSLNDPGDLIALAFRGSVPAAGIPTTLLIDRTGHIAARVVGGVSYSGLRALIAKVLAERS